MNSESGQDLAEYALIVALIAIVAIVAMMFLGSAISTVLGHASPTPAPSLMPASGS